MENFENSYEEILQFYALSGVDFAIEDYPSDRFLLVPPPLPNQSNSHKEISPNKTVLLKAKDFATKAQNLKELYNTIKNFSDFPFINNAKNMCFADGNPSSSIMFIDDIPKREEDQTGKPFSGAKGELLDNMLASFGYDRNNVYLTSIMPWRLPGDRAPFKNEISVFLPFLYKHIALISPKLIISFGQTPTTILLEEEKNLLSLAGKSFPLSMPPFAQAINDITLMPMLHPRDFMHNPKRKKIALRMLFAMKKIINN